MEKKEKNQKPIKKYNKKIIIIPIVIILVLVSIIFGVQTAINSVCPAEFNSLFEIKEMTKQGLFDYLKDPAESTQQDLKKEDILALINYYKMVYNVDSWKGHLCNLVLSPSQKAIIEIVNKINTSIPINSESVSGEGCIYDGSPLSHNTCVSGLALRCRHNLLVLDEKCCQEQDMIYDSEDLYCILEDPDLFI